MKHKDANTVVEETRNEELFISSLIEHNEDPSKTGILIRDVQLI